MRSYYVYILKCSDDSYYTGITGNLESRMIAHQEGAFSRCYTKSRRPITLVYALEFEDVGGAIAFEKQVKGWTRKKKEALINDDLELLRELAKSYSHSRSTKSQ